MDFNFLMSATGALPPSRKYQVEAGVSAIAFGTPLKLKAAGSNYVIPLADAEPVIGTTTNFVGFASNASTQTASVDGEVSVYVPANGVVYLAPAKTLAAIDTQAEYNALVGNNVLFDLTSSVYTVDQSATHDAANGLTIVDLNILDYPGKVAFTIREGATNLA
jgi:hypothetical protein